MIFNDTAISISITEQEADILQKALREYTGPYGADQSRLNASEKIRHDQMVTLALQLSRMLCEELQERTDARNMEAAFRSYPAPQGETP